MFRAPYANFRPTILDLLTLLTSLALAGVLPDVFRDLVNISKFNLYNNLFEGRPLDHNRIRYVWEILARYGRILIATSHPGEVPLGLIELICRERQFERDYSKFSLSKSLMLPRNLGDLDPRIRELRLERFDFSGAYACMNACF